MFGIRIALNKGKGEVVDKIEILEKTDVYFKNKTGGYIGMFGEVAFIELWQVTRTGSNLKKGKVVRRFKVRGLNEKD